MSDVLWQASPVSRPADPVLWSGWLGPDLLHQVLDSAPLPVCPGHCGTLWGLRWLLLRAGERRYSAECFA